jgi:hypothetical protein
MRAIAALVKFCGVIPGGAQRREGDPDFAVLTEKQRRLGSLPVPLRGPPGMTPLSLLIRFCSVIPGGAQRRDGDPDFAELTENQGRLGSLPVPLRGPPGMTPLSLLIRFCSHPRRHAAPGRGSRLCGADRKAGTSGFPSRPAARAAGNDTHVMASEAKPSILRRERPGRPDCFVAALLAMTGRGGVSGEALSHV